MTLPSAKFTYKLMNVTTSGLNEREVTAVVYGIVSYPDEFPTGIFTTEKDIAKIVCEALEEHGAKYNLGAGFYLLHNVRSIIDGTNQGTSRPGKAPKRNRRRRES